MPETTYSLSKLLRLLLTEAMNTPTAKNARDRRVGPYFREDPETLHSVFFEIQERYSKLFPPIDRLHFMTAGAHPYSSELTEALDRLQAAGAISRENPSFERFSRKPYDDSEEQMRRVKEEVVSGSNERAEALAEIVAMLEKTILVPQVAGA
jgi:hypothetical protein